ncbi:ASCH domain-containing protein [Polaromonas sp.]|uniref:ASCH domain-containing protein n=1 Tax=Polaromonas sp. TaxID=1869339 RepID=UPI003266BBD9
MGSTLYLPVKAVYFHAIAAGTKTEEYRLVTPYWRKRLVHRLYDTLVLTLGYPQRLDAKKRIELPYCGYVIKTITHPHFGPAAVTVFAINVSKP